MTHTSHRDGRRREFGRLLGEHRDGLRNYVRTLLPPLADAEEVVQEVAIAAWRKFHEFEPGTNFAAWVWSIARFEVLRARRKSARDRLVFDDDLVGLLADEGLAEVDAWDRERDALLACLERLSEEHRSVLERVHQPGESVHSAAEALGITSNALSKRLSRMRVMLLECVQHRLRERVP